MVYMQTPRGTRIPVTVTRAGGGTFDAQGDGVQFADVPVGITLEDEEGNALTALDAYEAARAGEQNTFLERVRACVEESGVLDGARRAEARLDRLLDAIGRNPLLAGIVEYVRSLEKGGEDA